MTRLLPALAVAALVLGVPAPAAAHGDEGTLEVLDEAAAPDGTAVTYTVGLTYANDGDDVSEAVVTARVRPAGGGAPLPPLTMIAIGPGAYAGAVTFPGPGRWRVTFTSAEPVAELAVLHEVAATTTTSAPPATTAPPTTTGGELVEGDTAGTDDGPPIVLVLGLVGAGALLVAGVVLGLLRRRWDPPET